MSELPFPVVILQFDGGRRHTQQNCTSPVLHPIPSPMPSSMHVSVVVCLSDSRVRGRLQGQEVHEHRETTDLEVQGHCSPHSSSLHSTVRREHALLGRWELDMSVGVFREVGTDAGSRDSTGKYAPRTLLPLPT